VATTKEKKIYWEKSLESFTRTERKISRSEKKIFRLSTQRGIKS
jgi:hypothetical protein